MSDGLSDATAAILVAVEAVEGPLAPKKRAVIVAALGAFAELGYAATSTRVIAQRAGVAEATIFRHFASKSDLLMRLVRPMARHLMVPAVVEAKAGYDVAAGNVEAMIGHMMRARLAFADRYAPLVRILLQELPVNPEVQGLLTEGVVVGLQVFADRMIANEVAAGRMFPIPAPRFLRIVASCLIGYWITRSMVAPGVWDDAAEIDAMAALLAHGLVPRE